MRCSWWWLGSACLANCSNLCFYSIFPVRGCLAELQVSPCPWMWPFQCRMHALLPSKMRLEHNQSKMRWEHNPFSFWAWLKASAAFPGAPGRFSLGWNYFPVCITPECSWQWKSRKKHKKENSLLFFNTWESTSTTPTPWWHGLCTGNRRWTRAGAVSRARAETSPSAFLKRLTASLRTLGLI